MSETVTAPEPPELEHDCLTRDGAIAMAARLNAYWLAQGHTTARFWVQPACRVSAAGKAREGTDWVVRSNLVRGLPPPTPGIRSRP